MSLTNLSDLLAAGSRVEVGGETFTLGPPSLGVQAEFARWVKDRAKREACVLDPQTPDEAADRLARQLMRDIGEGYYEPDAPGYVAALQRPDGIARMLYLVLRSDPTNPEVTEEKARKLVEDGLGRAWVQVLELEADDPKELRRVLAALGFPANWLDSSGPSASASPTPPSTGGPGTSPA